MTNERRRGFLRVSEHQAQELERWAYPDYSQQREAPSDNALNYDPSWQSEELEEEEEQGPPPLTASDLEDIRQSAYDEGVAEGKAAGHAEGFEAGKAEGLETGLVEGREQGLEQGLEQGQTQISEQVSHLMQLIEQLATPLQQIDTDVENQVLNLVTSLTRELIRVEVQTNPQVILNTIREVIATLPIAERQTKLSLHPDDLDVVRKAYGEDDLTERKWSLQAEPSLSRGDLQVKSQDSTVDYFIEDRIRHLLQQFSGANSQPSGGQ